MYSRFLAYSFARFLVCWFVRSLVYLFVGLLANAKQGEQGSAVLVSFGVFPWGDGSPVTAKGKAGAYLTALMHQIYPYLETQILRFGNVFYLLCTGLFLPLHRQIDQQLKTHLNRIPG